MTDHRTLNSEEHRELRIRTEATAELGDGVMACITTPYEFRQVQACFPIVFRRNNETGAFVAMALFGFTDGENLFLDDGEWTARYKPLAQSIQPFLIGQSAGGDGQAQIHIDMAHPRISTDGEGMRVFDELGTPTPYLETIARKLGDLHESYRDSGAFFDAMQRYELIEPFTLEVPLNDGSKNSLVGFHTIHEEKLQALGPAELDDLHKDGHLMPAFMVLASLSHFGDLVDRKNRQVGRG